MSEQGSCIILVEAETFCISKWIHPVIQLGLINWQVIRNITADNMIRAKLFILRPFYLPVDHLH